MAQGPWEKFAKSPPAPAPKTRTSTVPAARMAQIIADVKAGRQTAPRRAAAPPPKVTTKQQEIQALARRAVESERATTGNFLTALKGGIIRAPFGIPERIAAAGLRYLPSAITGNTSDASYDDILKVVRAKTDEELSGSLAGNITGQILGGAGIGGAIGKGVQRGAQSLAGAASPYAARAGNFLQNLVTVKKGQRVANTARVAAAGAAGGGAQAVGTDENVLTGAAFGAGGATALHGGAKALNAAVIRPVSDFLRTTSGKTILRDYVETPIEEIQKAARAWRARTGEEPTIFEVLPTQDRETVRKMLQRMPGSARERAATLVRERGAAMGPEVARQTVRTIGPQQRQRVAAIARELAESRGGPGATPTREEAALAYRAARSPVDMDEVRATTARNIMAPYDPVVVSDDIASLHPQTPVDVNGTIVFQRSDPEVSRVIDSVAGNRRAGENITVRDITDMISDLRDDVGKGGIDGRIAQRAIEHLETQLPTEAQEAATRMSAAYAGGSRRLEGMREGGQTRVREDVPVSTRAQANRVRQNYDTPEGATGRALGQAARLEADALASPQSALRAVQEIAENPTAQRAISENLGGNAGERIADAARAQTESAQRLAGLNRTAQPEDQSNLANLARALISLSPNSMVATRLQAVRGLSQMLHGLPAGRSETIVNGLFSRNPAQIAQSLRWFNNAGDTGKQALQALSTALVGGSLAGQAGNELVDQSGQLVPQSEPLPELPAEVPVDEAPAEPGPWDNFAEPEIDENIPYGRQVIESIFPGVEITDDVRDPDSELGRKNPGSNHVTTQNTVDVRPIPGMTFEEFVQRIRDEGHEIIEAIDEVKNPSKHATGKHWHVAIA